MLQTGGKDRKEGKEEDELCVIKGREGVLR